MADQPYSFSAQQENTNEKTPLLATEQSDLNHDTASNNKPNVIVPYTLQNMTASSTTTSSLSLHFSIVNRTKRDCTDFIKLVWRWIMAILVFIKLAMQWAIHYRPPEPHEDSSYPDDTYHWMVNVEVLGNQFAVPMSALIDTGTDCNLISRKTFNDFFDNDLHNSLDNDINNDLESLDFAGSPLELVTCQGQQVKIMRRKKVRVWFLAKTRDGKTSTRQKFHKLTFYVMEEEFDAVNFEILIGAETIMELRLLVPGPITIGPGQIRTKKPAVNKENIDADQTAADERRRQEEAERQAAQN